MMYVKEDGILFCPDCACYAANGDTSGIEDPAREHQVIRGVDAYGPHLVYASSGDDTGEYACDACGETWYGEKLAFAVLAPCSEKGWVCR